NSSEPWKYLKEDKERCESIMNVSLRIVKILAIASAPYMPKTAEKIWKMLGYKDSIHSHRWEDALEEIEENELPSPYPLFSKIELKDIIEEPFSKLDLRVAKINSIEEHPNADKLYIIELDVGEIGKRKIVAGIKSWYKKEELMNKKIVYLANLKEAKIRGVASKGMLLAADEGGKPFILLAKGKEGSDVFIDGIKKDAKEEIDYEEFSKIRMVSRNGKVEYNGKF
ncbi:MAG: class I tRNA ligase family protein, partial [Candidatus Thermoplasmatota archaeon]